MKYKKFGRAGMTVGRLRFGTGNWGCGDESYGDWVTTNEREACKSLGPTLSDGMRVRADSTIFAAGSCGISVLSPERKLLGLLRMPEIAANLCFDETGRFIKASTGVYHVDLR